MRYAISTATGPASGDGSSAMAKSSHIVTTCVTSDASPMRSGNRRASSIPETINKAASDSAKVRPKMPDNAPQTAEPSAKDPSEQSTCSATARARTQGGALVCVAVLKVDIADIHAAPATTSAK